MGTLEGSTLLVFWLILIGGMWLWMSRKRRTQEAERRSFLDSLNSGDEIVTIGGIYGTVEAVDGEIVSLRVADGVTIRLHKLGINTRAGD